MMTVVYDGRHKTSDFGVMMAVNLSHGVREGALEKITQKIKERGDLPHTTVEKQLQLLEGLMQFGLGRFLVETGGLNGYWTHYVITYPQWKKDRSLTELESFILDRAPSCLATQQRFQIFKEEAQKRLRDGISLASIPCGLTADLLDLDYSGLRDFSIYGIDIDPESLSMSEERCYGLKGHCTFVQKDAWNLGLTEAYDLITSNGLSIYEPEDSKVVALYRQFYAALKPGGTLITSFLTPPPWNDSVNKADALFQKILFADILDCKWQAFRTEEQVRAQLLEAGFTEVEIRYDEGGLFPTAIATKN